MNSLQDRLLFIQGLIHILKESFKESEFSKVIIPFIIIKKLESLLKISKNNVIEKYGEFNYMDDLKILNHFALDEKGEILGFYNFSKYDLNLLARSVNNLEESLIDYINCFSPNIKEVLDILDVKAVISNLYKLNLLSPFLKELGNSDMDLHFELMSNREFELIMEELLFNFSDDPTSMGKLFIPSDVLELLVRLLFYSEEIDITDKTLIKKIFDPVSSSGKLLDKCYDLIYEKNKSAEIVFYGQETRRTLYSISKINSILRKNDFKNIKGLNSYLSEDLFSNQKFDFIISNFSSLNDESEQILYLQKIISKMKINEKSRIAIITNETPLFYADKGSIQSKIRQQIIENDYLETIISLTENTFHIPFKPYIWILTNEKLEHRKGKVQFINGSDEFVEMKKTVLEKRNGISKSNLKNILELYGFKTNSKIVSFIDNNEIDPTDLSFKNIKFKEETSSGKEDEKSKIPLKTHDKKIIPAKGKKQVKTSESKKIAKKSKEFNQKEFEKWIESLPFPLASILYAYDVETNYDVKIKYILHFFESLSEFNFNLMLSAVSSNSDFYNKHFSKCRASHNRAFKKWFLKPTFGNWNNFGSCFAKAIRVILEDPNKKSELLQLFANSNESFVKMVSNKKFYNLLFKIAELRNRWEGHGPIVDKNEQEKRLRVLKKALIILKNIISDNYKDLNLIAPVESRYSEGVYNSLSKRLMTTRPPFKSIEVKTTIPLDVKKKYLVYKDSSLAIELLPLFDIMESPQKQQEACYFYNITEKDKVQFVSYHFNKEAIIKFNREKLEKVFKIIE
ncbi:MAG: SAM-dependent methyltransferase [Methanobrevibacter sp.]|nr:SAM-dependent methyltransferase [Methanobrevibacter sp.]